MRTTFEHGHLLTRYTSGHNEKERAKPRGLKFAINWESLGK